MKHLLRGLFIAALSICCSFQSASAQPMQTLPIDKNVRIGKLDNGLTYYIRHNALPEKRVEFYIAQKVGSILEEPEQRGLAHFLEHMAFNGTKNFPGDETGLGIVPWCETKGIKFGVNLNAYTSVDQTVYNISNVPTDNMNVVDSCLLILHDWSSAIKLSEKEIDKERGVIREEWRSRNSGIMRIYTNAQPVMYPDSKYADCMPIGSIDVINNFPYQAIRDYYAKWYRPDQQGIVIVGDINVDEIEAKLKHIFADVKAPVNPAERIYYPVADNEKPLIYIGTDKEVTTPSINFFFKHDATPDSLKNNIGYYATQYMLNMATGMLNSRFSELLQQANPPFTGASAGFGNYFLAKTKDAFSLSASSKADGIETAMKTILEEAERARRFGFTETEYERARANYLQGLESAYNEREKMKSGSYVGEYINHFLDNEPIPGIEYDYAIMNQMAPNIPVQAINQVMQQLLTDNNQVALIAGPEKEGIKYPTKEEIEALLKQLKSFDLKPHEDKVSNEPLISKEPEGGKIVSEKAEDIYGTTKLVLSNGVKVYVKVTDFKADQILMKGTSLGGSSLFADNEALNISQLNSVAGVGGVGNFSKVDLTKALAGKRASVSASIGGNTENISGNCSPKDFETMMQLTYLSFTAPRKDNEAFESYKNRLKAQLQNADANPMRAFGDTMTYALYNNHPRAINLKEHMVENIDYDRIIEMYKDRYKDASDFTFYLVGNVDLENMKPLIAKYLGGLPAIKRQETFRDTHMDIRKGLYKNEFTKKQETPMATILFFFNGECKYNLRNNLLLSFLDQALDMVYTEEIREKEGGTYGVSCRGGLSKYPKERLTLQIVFQTDPAKRNKLSEIVLEQLNKMAQEGPSAEHMQKIKEYMLKKYKDAQKENSYWLNNLDEYFYTGVDYTKDYEALVSSITAKDVQEFLAQLMEQKNEIRVIMTSPEEEEKKD
ncbi:pitrilysin family protein [Bacteroides pyogenes]|uniref:M16 family metallopeptidase n=1 Tax=Bacteroides pyogenes TaxID=310300 RepID=UPI001F2EB46E|nr:M16 family metallopeptidase [Bacteroides pyogenes]MCE9107919.1 insulinase family protein [Bacteroides pyogenes]MCF2709887.1 insulinase family protein [Bacteroides pyogenes]MDY5433881.1 insulinase family protein [Bacteroides pyogenes]